MVAASKWVTKLCKDRLRTFPLHIQVACFFGIHLKTIDLKDAAGYPDGTGLTWRPRRIPRSRRRFCHYCIARR